MVGQQRGAVARILGLAILAGAAACIAPWAAAAADNPAAASGAIAASPEAWRAAIDELPTPKAGCFTSSYPRIEWQQTVCVHAPVRPYPPARGSGGQLIGNGTDVSGEVLNLITKAIGEFPVVTGVTNEAGIVGGAGPKVANTYSLQLNTEFFTTSVCNGASGCQGWQQFIYSSSEGIAFMQYWLIAYTQDGTNSSCPNGWNAFGSDCFTNSNETTVHGGTPIPISRLVDLRVKATAVAGGNDSVIVYNATVAFAATGPDSMVELANSWNAAEFNLVGDCCASEAFFNAGASVDVELILDHTTGAAPACLGQGFTGETNNLSFVNAATHKAPGSPPAIHFLESSTATNVSPCSAAKSVGN